MREDSIYEAKLLWLHYSYSYLRLKVALLDLQLHLFNPNQPRVPAGRPSGGQWTDGDGDIIPVADNDRSTNDRYLNPHIIDRHVSKTDAELIARMERSTARGHPFSLIMDRNGTFVSAENARDLIKRTIDVNHETVERVASGDLQHAFVTWRFGNETGREAYRKPQYSENIQLRRTYMVGVEIEHDPKSELGYRIITAYPRNYDPRSGR